MTQKEIDKRLQDIRDVSDDPELAHSIEDKLREDFLKSLLTYYPKYAPILKKIRSVLSTSEIKFSRWCA